MIALLTAVVIVDAFAAPIALYELPHPDAVEAALATAGRSGIVVELPTGVRDGFGATGRFDHRALVRQMTHGHPLAGGFVARLSPALRAEIDSTPALVALGQVSAAADAFPVEELPTGRDLIALGITHVVINHDMMPLDVGRMLEARGFRLLVQTETRALYAVGGGP